MRAAFQDDRVQATRNLATNPSFEATSGSVEVRRNLMLTPNGYSGASAGWAMAPQWFGTGGSGTYSLVTAADGPVLPDGYSLPKYARKVWTVAPTTFGALSWQLSGRVNRPAVTAGQTYTASMYWRKSHANMGGRNRFEVKFWTASTGGTQVGTTLNSTDFANPGTNWQRVSYTFTIPATVTHVEVIHVLYAVGPEVVAGYTVDATAALVEQHGALLPYFDGTHSQDSELTPSWTGTVNASASIISGAQVTNVAASRAKAIQSTKWVGGGSKSLRLIPFHENNGSAYAELANHVTNRGLLEGKTYSVSATLHIETPLLASFSSRIIQFVYKIAPAEYISVNSPVASNVSGSTTRLTHTFTIPATATEWYLRIYNGGKTGEPDIWIDDLMIVEGQPVGGYVDGNQPGCTWEGAANASISRGWAKL